MDITVATGVINKEKTNRTELKSIAIGGKGFNTSRALNCLGMDNTAIAFLGGPFIENIKKMLAEEEIDSTVIPIKGSTRVNLKVVEEETGRLVEFNENGPLIEKSELEDLNRILRDIGPGADFFIMSGSLPKDMDEMIYQRIIEILKEQKTRVLLDASGPSLYHGLEALPHIVKVNREEISGVCERYYKAGPESVIRDLVDRGIKMVMVTDGPRDAFYYDHTGKYRIKSPDILGPYKTGAGDAVNAGLIFALKNDYQIEERLKFAAACGNANILTGVPGEVDIKTVQSLVPRIKIKKEKG